MPRLPLTDVFVDAQARLRPLHRRHIPHGADQHAGPAVRNVLLRRLCVGRRVASAQERDVQHVRGNVFRCLVRFYSFVLSGLCCHLPYALGLSAAA